MKKYKLERGEQDFWNKILEKNMSKRSHNDRTGLAYLAEVMKCDKEDSDFQNYTQKEKY